MIDSRFPPLLKKVEVPLYPLKNYSRLRYSTNESLESYLANYYSVSEEQIYLADRASSLLYFFLKWYSKKFPEMKVAIPAFCCFEVCQAVLQAGCIPVFLDIEESCVISEKSLYFASENQCRILIFPHYFGFRSHLASRVELAKKLGLFFINDEAQSFPEVEQRFRPKCDLTLFSFGTSKRLGCPWGGGFCFSNEKLSKEFWNDFNFSGESYGVGSYLKHFIKRKAQLFKPYYQNKIGLNPNLEKDMEVLLEKKKCVFPCKNLSQFQKNFILHFIKQYAKSKNVLMERLEKVKMGVIEAFGNAALDYLQDVSLPSTLAIRIPETISRRSFFSYFSDNFIQTTWYYFPLNQLSFLKKFPAEELKNTEKVARSIGILPFQWKHSQGEVTALLFALKGFRENY